MLIEGIFAAITTPFYPDERVYLRKLEANVARYSRSLLAGLVVLGSTGEAVTLNDEETREVLRTAAGAARPEKVLIAGVGRESLRSTIELAEAAAGLGYDAALVRLPAYYSSRFSVPVVLNYLRAVADRSPLPVLLYNIPKFVPYAITGEIARELAPHPSIIGIKDSTGNMEQVRSLIEATRDAPRRTVTVTPVFEAVTGRMLRPQAGTDAGSFVAAGDLAGGAAVATAPPQPQIRTRTREVGFQVLTGSAATILEGLAAGAAGAILGFAACAPEACQEVYLAWKDHDHDLAGEKQERIIPASRRIVNELGIGGVKYACDFNGYYGGNARLPLVPLPGEQRAEIEGLLAGIRS